MRAGGVRLGRRVPTTDPLFASQPTAPQTGPVVYEIPDKRAHLSPAVNVVLRHVRCPMLQK
jgi:hypothetical protein